MSKVGCSSVKQGLTETDLGRAVSARHTFPSELTSVPPSLQIGALRCSGGVANLVVLDRDRLKPRTQGIAAGGVTIDNELKWKVGEAEFESLMRMLDNLVSDP